nr:MAG TPA: hypothetical protein [Caudoviricetes sp.]
MQSTPLAILVRGVLLYVFFFTLNVYFTPF